MNSAITSVDEVVDRLWGGAQGTRGNRDTKRGEVERKIAGLMKAIGDGLCEASTKERTKATAGAARRGGR